MNKKIIQIQPHDVYGGHLPYPYFIDEKGLVGRQDFWKGKPFRLIGFNGQPTTGDIDVSFNDFWQNPKIAVGMYPVFTDKKKNWFTHQLAIVSFRIKKEVKSK